MTTRICIIRHGETDWNREKRIQGQLDIPLNDTGRAQALAMAFNAAHHTFSAIYSSDLSRALDTAKALASRESLEVIVSEQLRERHYGILQSVTKDEAKTKHPQAHARYAVRDLHYDFETGESLLAFSQRVITIFNELASRHRKQQIAVICHAGVLDVLYRHATGRSLESARDFAVPNCALNWFEHRAGQWQLRSWDEHQHLGRVTLDSVE
ncbi:MAG: histidine phosphatase family protein [Gammaproteobacteria bacterium]|nr:histidine phosphatase family protein [Gammaproteobacteria bacterium]